MLCRVVRSLRVLCLVAAVMAVPRASSAQSGDVPEIVTDRPDFTESSEVIAKGRFQFESGVSFESDGNGVEHAGSFAAPAALMRIGFGWRTELRLGAEGLLSESIGDVRSSGYSDFELGAKVRLLNQDQVGFDLAVIPIVSLPVGADGFSSGTVDPTVKVTWARELPAGFGLTGNLNASMLSDEQGRFDQKAASFSLGHDLFAGWGGYVEAYGFSRQDRSGAKAITINGGVSRAIDGRMQFDLEAGRGVTDAAPDWFVGFGFAITGGLRR